MAGLETKSFASPDEARPFADKGNANVINVGGHPVIFGTFESGWRWFEHIKAIARAESCQAPHLLYCLSGRMKVAMEDGTEGEITPGDVVSIEPGDDAGLSVTSPALPSISEAGPIRKAVA